MQRKSLISLAGSVGGASILAFGLFLFSLQDIIIKFFSDQYSVLQIVFIRGLVSMAVIALLIKLFWRDVPFISSRPVAAIARGLTGFFSYLTYYLVVAAMPLAEVVDIVFIMPLFVTAMSATQQVINHGLDFNHLAIAAKLVVLGILLELIESKDHSKFLPGLVGGKLYKFTQVGPQILRNHYPVVIDPLSFLHWLSCSEFLLLADQHRHSIQQLCARSRHLEATIMGGRN
jgi:drug/metabolite transporter (DMT)-like permease